MIQERDGVIFVNGQSLVEPYVTNKTRMNWGPYVIPQDHYWVMGDNRPNSADSRSSLAKKDIIGRAILRFWLLNSIEILL